MNCYPARTIFTKSPISEASCTTSTEGHVRTMLTAVVFQNTSSSGQASIVASKAESIPMTEPWVFPEEDQEYDITLSQDWGAETEFMGDGELKRQFP